MNSKKKTENPNRDPITCEPGSHPVGTGAGALAGGAAGAAAGAAAGPVGAGVGAAAGAVIGGLGGKAVGEKFNPTHSSEIGRFIDYTVVDRSGDKVGTVDAVWEDEAGQPYYLAVRTGWLGLGKAHVVPAERAEVNERDRKIRLPYEAELMKNAPAFDCAADMDDHSHRSIREYFGLKRGGTAAPSTNRDVRDTRGARDLKDEATIKLKAEEVNIGKREVEYGGIRLRKIVRTETVNQPVELKREEIVVERTPVNREAGGDANFDEKEVYIPLRREEPVVEKRAVTKEEVHVGKRTDVDRREVSETFRREDVEIEKEGEAHVSGEPRRRKG